MHILLHDFHPIERVLEALQFPTIQNMYPAGKGISTSLEKIEDPLIVFSQRKGIDPSPSIVVNTMMHLLSKSTKVKHPSMSFKT